MGMSNFANVGMTVSAATLREIAGVHWDNLVASVDLGDLAKDFYNEHFDNLYPTWKPVADAFEAQNPGLELVPIFYDEELAESGDSVDDLFVNCLFTVEGCWKLTDAAQKLKDIGKLNHATWVTWGS